MLTSGQSWIRVKRMVEDALESKLITGNNGYYRSRHTVDGNVEFEVEGRTYSIMDVTGESDYFESRSR